ncbi:MAG TPA: serine hydrolase domain-containing protein [Candidatus Paceibacterota bacterium]|nr:serine hydrolase domain-containing protein [Verrucomicrobiota bacterium]HSA09459.1 serine hydrolase domain-containing protein [Candidatus Paceibacterota bacterium]
MNYSPLALLLSAATAIAAAAPDFSETAAILRRGIEDHAFPGCTVVVGTADKVLWSEAFGCLDYTGHVPVTKQTLYDLASVTKVAGTTSVFMQLMQQGKVRMSDPVSAYLPEFIDLAPDDEDKAKRKQITVGHLLTHTAGLTSWKAYYRTQTNYAAMLRAILTTPLESDPGARVRYSDFGMLLAGEVAARAGKKPLADLEQVLVFSPLCMTNTLRNPPAGLHARIAPTEKWPNRTNFVHGVVHDENSRAAEGITGHAGLFSTAEDLGKLATELLRADEGKSQWLSQPVFAEFARPHELARGGSRGLGWGLERGEKRAIGHNGFTGTYIRVDLDRKLHLALLTNAVHPTRDNHKLGTVRREAIAAILRAFDKSLAPDSAGDGEPPREL